jgi:hypothetical protein
MPDLHAISFAEAVAFFARFARQFRAAKIHTLDGKA